MLIADDDDDLNTVDEFRQTDLRRRSSNSKDRLTGSIIYLDETESQNYLVTAKAHAGLLSGCIAVDTMQLSQQRSNKNRNSYIRDNVSAMTPNNKRLISAGLDSNTSDGRQFNVSASVMNKQIKSIAPM